MNMILYSSIFYAFIKRSLKNLPFVVISLFLSACNNLRIMKLIFMEFYIGEFTSRPTTGFIIKRSRQK
jgi:hypothetical protein